MVRPVSILYYSGPGCLGISLEPTRSEERDGDELFAHGGLPPEHDTLEGCTPEDVGWMKVLYNEVETLGFVNMHDNLALPPSSSDSELVMV